jgi:hypothetical protein
MSVVKKIAKVLLFVIGAGVFFAAGTVAYLHWSDWHMRTQALAHEASWRLGTKFYSYDDVDTDDVQHFLGPNPPLRSRFSNGFDAVYLTVIVRPDGTVADAWPTRGNPLFVEAAVTIAKGWKFVPFKHDGRPVWIKIDAWNVDIYPPERRPPAPVPFPEVRDWSSVRITLQRTACYGTCPAYRVEIGGDGTVTYEGRAFVVVEGEHHAKIPVVAVRSLVEKFRAAEFFRLYRKYTAGVTDNPTQTLSIAIDGKTMTVVDYVGEYDGMPSVVVDLEREVDRVAGTKRWSRSSDQTVPALIAEGWNFKTNSCENRALLAGVAEYGSLAELNALLAQGVFPDKPCPSRFRVQPNAESALAEAAERHEVDMVDALLRAGAASDQEALRFAIDNAAEIGDRRILDVLLPRLQVPASYTTYRGHTPLMAGAGSCVPEAVAALLKAGADVTAKDDDGNTALIAAADYSGDYPHRRRTDTHCDRTVALLLEAGADPWASNANGKTALDTARGYPNAQKSAAARVLEAWMKTHPKPKK